MKACCRDVVDIFVRIGNVASDQLAELVHAQTEFPSGLCLRVLRLITFSDEDSLAHTSMSILRAKLARPNRAESLYESLVSLMDFCTKGGLSPGQE